MWGYHIGRASGTFVSVSQKHEADHNRDINRMAGSISFLLISYGPVRYVPWGHLIGNYSDANHPGLRSVRNA